MPGHERAIRVVVDHEKDHASRWAAVGSIAAKIGCSAQTLNEWVKKAEVDSDRYLETAAWRRMRRADVQSSTTLGQMVQIGALRIWGAILALALSIYAADLAEAQQVNVTRGHAITVELGAPANTVVVGDETIADAAIAFDDTIVVTGREPGSTSLIVFDHQGSEMYNSTITVSPAFDAIRPVVVLGAGHRRFLDCTPVYCVARREPDSVIQSDSTVTQSNGGQIQSGTAIRQEFN